jgi:hypothetical protein
MSSVNVSLIELVETTEDKHHQERIGGFDVDYYPSYHEGETLFYKKTSPKELGHPLTQFKIVEVHHSVRQYEKKSGSFLETIRTMLSIEVYLRKID